MYLDPARELKKHVEHKGDSDTNGGWCSWDNSRKMVKGLVDLEIREQVETIQTTALTSGRILTRVQETEVTCCHSNSSEKPSVNAGVESSQMSK